MYLRADRVVKFLDKLERAIQETIAETKNSKAHSSMMMLSTAIYSYKQGIQTQYLIEDVDANTNTDTGTDEKTEEADL
jgi:hypothetical protein